MKKFLASDSALKLLALAIAISLWFYVVQAESPDTAQTIRDVPVVFTQKASLEEKNLILLNDNEYTVDVKIHGPRNYAIDANRKNITILADVSSIDSTGEHVLTTTVMLPYASLELVNKKPSVLSVSVDHLVTVKKPVEIITEGTPKNSYVTGNLSASLETVEVTGPKSILDGIESAAVLLDINNLSADIKGTYPLMFLGTNDKEIESTLLSLSAAEVEVHAEILKSKTLPLKPVFSGADEEYILDESSIKTVTVAGASAAVDALSEIKTEPFSSAKISASGEVVVKLSLPQGIRSLDGDSITLRYSKKPSQ